MCGDVPTDVKCSFFEGLACLFTKWRVNGACCYFNAEVHLATCGVGYAGVSTSGAVHMHIALSLAT